MGEHPAGTDQAIGAGAHAAGATVVPPVPEPTVPPEAAHAAAGSILHDAGVSRLRMLAAGLGAQVIRVGDVQVVAGDINIEIVLERERDGVSIER